MRKGFLTATLVVATAVFAAAGTINVGNGASGTNPTGLLAPMDPVLVQGATDISVFLQGSASISSSFTLALIVPNDTNGAGVNGPGAITLYPSFPGAGSACGSCTVSSMTDAGTLGASAKLNTLISGFSHSLNASNFDAFDSALGITAADFGIYDWTVGTPSLDGHDKPLLDISIPGGEPLGSIFAALTDNGQSVVWTNAGGVNGPTSTPEPASLALLGAGLLLVGLASKKRILA